MKASVYTNRKYGVLSVKQAKEITGAWLESKDIRNLVKFGLPEVDDRYHIWRVPLVLEPNKIKVGEAVIDAFSSLVDEHKSTKSDVLKKRVVEESIGVKPTSKGRREIYQPSALRNTIALGDAESVLREMAAKSVDLVFTSPPYFNARPEYSDYINYEEYLLKMRKIISEAHRVLNEGRFFVMNVSPVLIRRASRSEASKRIAVPFDLHRIFIEEGFEFIDDIHWVKPSGAGWATGRGRRFAADRNPLQYKAVPVTEYVLVYRKQSDKLIDWNIRTYPDKKALQDSKIEDGYETTNLWRIHPAYDKRHPAIFPIELAQRVISYYSIKTDVVLDPFVGIGTTVKAALKLGRRFVGIDIEPKYIEATIHETKKMLGKGADEIFYINCSAAFTNQDALI